MPSFRKEVIDTTIKDVCRYFDCHELTMIERWYVCLCIQKAAEGIMGEGFQEIADSLEKKYAPAE